MQGRKCSFSIVPACSAARSVAANADAVAFERCFARFDGEFRVSRPHNQPPKSDCKVNGAHTLRVLALCRNYEHTGRVKNPLSRLDGEVPVRAAKRRVRLKRE